MKGLIIDLLVACTVNGPAQADPSRPWRWYWTRGEDSSAPFVVFLGEYGFCLLAPSLKNVFELYWSMKDVEIPDGGKRREERAKSSD